MKSFHSLFSTFFYRSLTAFIFILAIYSINFAATQIDITGPADSKKFGSNVTVLPNGNFVVTDADYGSTMNHPVALGAVYLFDGKTGEQISKFIGNDTYTYIGTIKVLENGNFLIISYRSVTWCSAVYGCSVTVSSDNSLIGTKISSLDDVITLPNGNFVLRNKQWQIGTDAVTFGNGKGETNGIISASNSLIVIHHETLLNNITNVITLPNGNYLISNCYWENGTIYNAGFVAWGDGEKGLLGVVSEENALVGSSNNDFVGYVKLLSNGNYVVGSPSWDNENLVNVGAVTWCNGQNGTVGRISAANSLIGIHENDYVGSQITVLNNGNYVVSSNWKNGTIVNAGAVTWGNGEGGTVGEVSSQNSLVGSRKDDFNVIKITPLTNGNYVVAVPNWNNKNIIDAGAATWCNGNGGTIGIITPENSLVGDQNSAGVGSFGVTALANGNYVVKSPDWRNQNNVSVGAATWGNGEGGTVGYVSEENSLVGSNRGDCIACYTNNIYYIDSVIPLTNGNYVVISPLWKNGNANYAGAVTWGNGQGGTVGEISAANSLVGSSQMDFFNDADYAVDVQVLPNSNYLVNSSQWDNGNISNVGFVAWGDGTKGVSGVVSQENALVGTNNGDVISIGAVLPNGNYVVQSPYWDNGSITDVGAVTLGNGQTGRKGIITSNNSIIGTNFGDKLGGWGLNVLPNGNFLVKSKFNAVNNGFSSIYKQMGLISGNSYSVGELNSNNSVVFSPVDMNTYAFRNHFTFIPNYEYLIVGRPLENKITIFKPTYTAVADGNWSDGNVWDYGAFSQPQDVYIPNGRSVNLDSVKTVNTLQIGCQGNLIGADESSYIIGNVRKDFCQNKQSFSFPIGTENRFSPVDVNITSLSSPSSITIKAKEGNRQGMIADNSLQRYWTLNRSGNFLFDAVFHYPENDVVGDESSYKLYRFPSQNAELQNPFELDTSANTMTKRGIVSSGDWTIGNAPIGITFSGKVKNASGRSVKDAIVTITYPNGQTYKTRTTSLGTYKFTGLEVGKATISVTSSLYTFTPQEIGIDANLSELNFTALP